MVKPSSPSSISWCSSSMAMLVLMLLCCFGWDQREVKDQRMIYHRQYYHHRAQQHHPWRHVCDEIYVVREGETLNTISEKCGDPFIVENNPHIQDPDDVFPGLVIKITPYYNGR